MKFDKYCKPHTQVIYQRYHFNNRKQEAGESIAAYVTELRMIAKNCAHDGITPDKILHDCLVLGIRDYKVREWLLRITDLTLQKALDICKAPEQTSQQLKMMSSASEEMVGAVRQTPQNQRKTRDPTSHQPECPFCGFHHANRQCPAFGQTCRKYGQKNHFQSKCRLANPRVNNIEMLEEVFRISQVGTGLRAMITMGILVSSPLKFK